MSSVSAHSLMILAVTLVGPGFLRMDSIQVMQFKVRNSHERDLARNGFLFKDVKLCSGRCFTLGPMIWSLKLLYLSPMRMMLVISVLMNMQAKRVCEI